MSKTVNNRRQNESAYIAMAVVKQIKKRMGDFTPRQRVLAEFVMQNPESVAFLPIRELAKESGVSQATIVRFSNLLNYDGYAHLSREAQQIIQYELSTAGRFNLAHTMGHQSIRNHAQSAFERIVTREIDNLINLTKSIKTTDFYRCVDMMTQADHICIIGGMGSSSLASFFGYALAKIFHPVYVLHNHDSMAHWVANSWSPDSLVFLISFPRYPKVTMELGRLAFQKGAKIITITNSHVSPVVPLASLSFFVSIGILSFIDAYAAPIAFINALVTEFGERNPAATRRKLQQFDEYASEENLFLRLGGMVANNVTDKLRNNRINNRR
jgi:DNA-binding MurR/RpiR family transcriptional regulator